MKFLLLLFAAAGAMNAETLTSTSMVPYSALRGIPPAVRLEVRNTGTSPVAIPRTYVVEVVLPSGERFTHTVPPDSAAG